MMSIRKQFEHLRIQLEAIISTTNNFAADKCIGRGGFGKVYKGDLVHSKGHTTVAIKRLDRAFGQGDPEFWREIIMLSLYRHENIVSLLGFCDESGEKILVYEYESKRSLDLHLTSNDLTWVRRLNICIGVARGLAYLHDPAGSQQRLLHRDIKSSNILLDENWNAKISDLGLSKFGPANQHYTFIISRAVGTFGYCDPLYVETGLLTKESDVYSFGVVMFEVLCGRLCIDNKGMHQPFTELVRNCYNRNSLREITFSNIKDDINPCSLKAFTTLANSCLKRDRGKRPLMIEVVRILETALKYQVPPSSPPPLPPQRSKSYNILPPPPLPESLNVPPPPPHSYGSSVPPPTILSGVISSDSSNQRPLKTLQPVKTSAKVDSLWDVSHKQGNQSRAPEIDITELENLFSTASVSTGTHKDRGHPGSEMLKPTNVRLVKPLRARTWETMLVKINLSLPDIINAILALDSSALSVHQVYNLIEFCPTKEEMEMVKSYTADKKMPGQCEEFFLECAKIPRIKQKLRVFAFTITFSSQVHNLRDKLSTIKDATKEIMESTKLVKIMQIILTMGNKLNAGRTQGSSGGFRLDNFRNLGYTYATDKKITLLHYLCKVVSEQTPELFDFDKDLVHLQSASIIQIKSLHEDKLAIIKGIEKVQQEFEASTSDGGVSARFREALKSFLDSADAQLPSLTLSLVEVAKYTDTLAVYFGEDPSHSPWEQVITSLVRFIVKFKKAHDENKQWEDAEKE